jgi:hypothetical protein
MNSGLTIIGEWDYLHLVMKSRLGAFESGDDCYFLRYLCVLFFLDT